MKAIGNQSGAKPKAYLLCSEFAAAESSGGKVRIMQNLRMLDTVYDAQLLSYGKVKGIRRRIARFFRLRKQLSDADLCVIEEPKLIFLMLFLPVRCIYSSHNFETALRWHFLKNRRNFHAMMNFAIFAAGEFLAIRRAEAVIAISETLKKQLRRYTRRPIFAIPPFPETDAVLPVAATDAGRNYICVGSFDWPPNLDGYRFFVTEVLPKLDANTRHFHFVGKHNERFAPVTVNGNTVSCHGYIADLDAFYAKMQGVMVPIVSGSGIKMKLIEAIGKGLPIMTTDKGAEGLEAYGAALGAAGNATAFAERIMAVERDVEHAAAATEDVRSALTEAAQREWQAFFAYMAERR
ncbi:glycosyltransferase [Sulfurimonas sp. HSL-3221]|uniref:glycosyltransferase n=1 Tax=Sulfurimonadaceae TaxID=2771471 RepID=UPI001E5B2B3A|nr:glycosyltransferase [Sulfurimonas sp. HSL-3221]UFS62404.1 glycosyltransferase [Sulfurimonas sp. HSL-3221]